MPDMLPLSWTTSLFALVSVASLWICGALGWGAWRNHFWRHTTRPIAIASSVMFFTLSLFFGEQAVIDAYPNTVPWHYLIVRSGYINAVLLVLLVIGIGAWFFTVSIGYPDMHRIKGQKHDRTSHVD